MFVVCYWQRVQRPNSAWRGWGKERFISYFSFPFERMPRWLLFKCKTWQRVFIARGLSPIVACKQALRLEIARVVLARRLAVTKVFTDLLMPGTFFYSSRCDMQFILVSEHMELLTRVCRVLIVLKIEVYRGLLEWRYLAQLSRSRTNDCMNNKMVLFLWHLHVSDIDSCVKLLKLKFLIVKI